MLVKLQEIIKNVEQTISFVIENNMTKSVLLAVVDCVRFFVCSKLTDDSYVADDWWGRRNAKKKKVALSVDQFSLFCLWGSRNGLQTECAEKSFRSRETSSSRVFKGFNRSKFTLRLVSLVSPFNKESRKSTPYSLGFTEHPPHLLTPCVSDIV